MNRIIAAVGAVCFVMVFTACVVMVLIAALKTAIVFL